MSNPPSRRRRRRLQRENIALDLTPMVDVVFLLIIFFMVSTTFITLETALPIDLPKAQSSQVQASDVPTVSITRDQAIFVQGEPVTLETLASTLINLTTGKVQNVVIIRADETVPHGLTVQVMDAIKQAGMTRIAIATGGE